MSVGHDPCTDPLTPYWRSRVEAVFAGRSVKSAALTRAQARWCALADANPGVTVRELARRKGHSSSVIWAALRQRRLLKEQGR